MMSKGIIMQTIISIPNKTINYARAFNKTLIIDYLPNNTDTTNDYDNKLFDIYYNDFNFALMIFNSAFFLLHLPVFLCLVSSLYCVVKNYFYFTVLFVTISTIIAFYIVIFFIEAKSQIYIGFFFGFCFIVVIAMDIFICIALPEEAIKY